MTIERFDGTGIDRFLRYRSFMAEYNEFVLAKPVPDLIKLRWLKNSLDGEALKLVKEKITTTNAPLLDISLTLL